MSISFERFVALTAALATASTVMAGCGDDDGTTNPGAGGTGGNAGKGGKAGRAGAGGSHAGAGSGGTSGRGGSQSTGGSAGAEEGGHGAVAPSAGEGGLPGSGGTAQGGSSGNEPTAGAGEGGAGATPGSSGEAGQSGAGGAPEEPCFGDEGTGYCFGLPDGDVPSDECVSGPNPAWRSCVYSQTLLRAGVLDAHGSCLVPITDACTLRAAIATDECERETLRRACPTVAAADICENGYVGASVLPSPLVACDDGTLTLASCTQMLSAVASSALENIVRCSDPAGEYGGVFSGTCAERLQQCIFPHGALYP